MSTLSRATAARPGLSIRSLILVAIALSVVMVHWAAASWNDSSRMATVQALVEHGTLSIDQTAFAETQDKVFVNGRFYSDKPPYPSLIASVVYWPLHQLGLSLSDGRNVAYYLVTLITMKTALLAALWCFYRTLRLTGLDERQRVLLTGALALGSLLLSWTAVFNNHGLAASFIGIGFCAFIEARHREKPLPFVAISGFFLSLAAACDVPTGVVYAAFGVVLVTDPRLRRYTLAYGLPCLVTVVPYLAINAAISGSILPLQIHQSYFDYPGSPWVGSGELSGVSANGPAFIIGYAWGCLFGKNGFILYNPLLLLAVPMLVLEIRRRGPFWREAVAVAVATSLIFVYYVSVTTNESGWSYSIRWFVPLLPLLYFFLYGYLARMTPFRKRAFVTLFAISVLIAVVGVVNPWSNRRYSDTSFLANVQDAVKRVSDHLDVDR